MFKRRDSKTWHRNINVTAEAKKPTDGDFPWIALQNHTGFYLKKKASLSQTQIDERLLALIENEPSKFVAVAACAHRVSVTVLRELITNRLKVESDIKVENGIGSEPQDYLHVILATRHVNSEAINQIEERRARWLLEYYAYGGSGRTLGQQLQTVLPLMGYRVYPEVILQSDISRIAYEVCRDFAVQLDSLRQENQWRDAHQAVAWLSTLADGSILHFHNPQASHILENHLKTWKAWAAWRPQTSRIAIWGGYALRAPASLGDIIALEGPDFVSLASCEKATLRDGLVAKGLNTSEPVLCWGNFRATFTRNPFLQQGNSSHMLQRLSEIIDFATTVNDDYTQLIVCLCVGKTINVDTISILEAVQNLELLAFSGLISQLFKQPDQNVGQDIELIRQLLPRMRGPRFIVLREKIKPYLVYHVSAHVRRLQQMLLDEIKQAKPWIVQATELLLFGNELKEEAWLLGGLVHFLRDSVTFLPAFGSIETLGRIRDSIRSPNGSIVPQFLSEIDAYCRTLLVPETTGRPPNHGIIEALIDIWKDDQNETRRELALLVAQFPNTSEKFRWDCLRDVRYFASRQASSALIVLGLPGEDFDKGFYTFVKFLISKEGNKIRERWRQVLGLVIEENHFRLLNRALESLTAEKWLRLLTSIGEIFKGSIFIAERGFPHLMGLELHTWSQQVQRYIPTLIDLEKVLRHGPAMQLLLSGSTALENEQLLQVLDFVKNTQTPRKRLVTTLMSVLNKDNIGDVLSALKGITEVGEAAVETCLAALDSRHQASPGFAEVKLANNLQENDINERDRFIVRKVAGLFGIHLSAKGKPSIALIQGLEKNLHAEYLKLIIDAHRLENLRLSLQAVAPEKVSTLLTRLSIEAPSIVDDALTFIPQSLSSLVTKVSNEVVGLQFPMTDLTRMQRSAIGLSKTDDTESFLIRLTLGQDGTPPVSFCVHLSSDCASESRHVPWETLRGVRPPFEQYCHGRPNRGVYQLSRILWGHLRQDFKSLEQTHAHITSKLSRFGQGCVVCGAGQLRLRRATACSLPTCQNIFSKAHVKVALPELWQDVPVMDLLLNTIAAASLTGNTNLLAYWPDTIAPAVHMLNQLPALPALSKHLDSCLNVYEKDFHFPSALKGLLGSPSCLTSDPNPLAELLRWASTSHRGFLVSATGGQRIPSFGDNQFLLANMAPDLEAAFAQHMPTPSSPSQILFHGTSLDRLHAILCQGLRVQSGGPLQRHGAAFGAGIYMADEPSVAWSYRTAPTRDSGWKNSNLKNLSVLLGCELAGQEPQSSYGIYVITDPTRLAVRYIFLLTSNTTMPAAKDVRLPMGSVFQSMRNGTL